MEEGRKKEMKGWDGGGGIKGRRGWKKEGRNERMGGGRIKGRRGWKKVRCMD